jgi:hypothetical protein
MTIDPATTRPVPDAAADDRARDAATIDTLTRRCHQLYAALQPFAAAAAREGFFGPWPAGPFAAPADLINGVPAAAWHAARDAVRRSPY